MIKMGIFGPNAIVFPFTDRNKVNWYSDACEIMKCESLESKYVQSPEFLGFILSLGLSGKR